MSEVASRIANLVEDAVRAALDDRDVVRAAGGVVYRTTDEGVVEVVVIHRPEYDDWSLPKGKTKSGERLEATALREVEEETGLICLVARSLGTLDYIDRRGREKVVWYWLMRAVGGEFKPTEEVDRMRWLPFEAALKKLSYKHDRDLLLRAGPIG
ncbi:MAG: 8-oxo-dGTP diphosphatase [Chloroflexota bacterium]|nr:8-oxo-dGTP diphosphatase [Chloroflexota bacterium]